jgi:hypothetical protein
MLRLYLNTEPEFWGFDTIEQWNAAMAELSQRQSANLLGDENREDLIKLITHTNENGYQH